MHAIVRASAPNPVVVSSPDQLAEVLAQAGSRGLRRIV
jgi:hypothetical protein